MDEKQKKVFEQDVYEQIFKGNSKTYQVDNILQNKKYFTGFKKKDRKEQIQLVIDRYQSPLNNAQQDIDEDIFSFISVVSNNNDKTVIKDSEKSYDDLKDSDNSYDDLYYGDSPQDFNSVNHPVAKKEIRGYLKPIIIIFNYVKSLYLVGLIRNIVSYFNIVSKDHVNIIFYHMLAATSIFSLVSLVLYTVFSLLVIFIFLVFDFSKDKKSVFYIEIASLFVTMQTIFSSLLNYDSIRAFILTDMIILSFLDATILIINMILFIFSFLFLKVVECRSSKKKIWNYVIFIMIPIFYFSVSFIISSSFSFLLFIAMSTIFICYSFIIAKTGVFFDHRTYAIFIYLFVINTVVLTNPEKFINSYYDLFLKSNEGYCEINLKQDSNFTDETEIIRNSNNPNKILIKNINFDPKDKTSPTNKRFIYRKC